MGSVRKQAVFGGVDGLTMVMAIVTGLLIARQPGSAAWHAAFGGAGGELVGMSAGQYLSDREAGLKVALTVGVAGGSACVLPAIPFALLPRFPAACAAVVTVLVLAGVIAWLRPEHGLQAVLRTYGILLAAGLLSGLTGL